MPAKASCEVKTRTVRQPQKNGDIYVIERQTRYDPVKKYNVVLSSRIVGKIPKGETSVVPTRPKRSSGEKVSVSNVLNPPVAASRRKVGMMDIIDHIGKASGIDDAVYASTDQGTAQKILSLARYLLATNGQSFPGITTWQFMHPLPYEDGLTEDIYHDVFEAVGRDESLIQSFFESRLSSLGSKALLAYDSTTISTYSGRISEARYGFNKAHDGLETVKLLSLYSIETRQPVAFTKQPGNQPDVITIENALKQLQVLGINNAEIVTDNGYYSEKNLAELLHAHFDFITLIKNSPSGSKKNWTTILTNSVQQQAHALSISILTVSLLCVCRSFPGQGNTPARKKVLPKVMKKPSGVGSTCTCSSIRCAASNRTQSLIKTSSS